MRVRAELKDLTLSHVDSVLFFLDKEEESFFLTSGHKHRSRSSTPISDGEVRKVRRLTTTFTCLESLFDGGERGVKAAEPLLRSYSDRALERPEDWTSEGEARTYCRVRSLAPLLRLRTDLDEFRSQQAKHLLVEAWSGVAAVPGSDGIFEEPSAGGTAKDEENRYPPNAYLSYWGMATLNSCDPEATFGDIAGKRPIVESWFEKTLAKQVALHYSASRLADPQQLAWAICGVLISRSEPLAERSPAMADLVSAGLRAFFEQQDGGAWPRGEPLFHYPKAGNAYCYTFETLAELVHLALGSSSLALAFRAMLEPYADCLIASYRHAVGTARRLDAGTLRGWSSGHHPQRTSPESWATASVFRFLQGMRRLVGIWTREYASELLGARQPRGGLEVLEQRGDTWDTGHGAAGAQLATLFVNPKLAIEDPEKSDDPDVAASPTDHARSAILYGPPGTGKTTLVEAVAGALKWKFIEITPALFLDRGVELVSARADEVFRLLMELDHHVVLLDEIDELIRRRNDLSDSLERFFTTTMLPRLAKLWEQRRILFFVNTNSIDSVDPAILRSQRFDAAIFVMPPSYEAKENTLEDSGTPVKIDRGTIEKLLRQDFGEVAETRRDLAWFGFLRWDQLRRLGNRLRVIRAESGDDEDALVTTLHQFGMELMGSDWLHPDVDASDMTLERVLKRYSQLVKFQRRDFGAQRVVAAEESIGPPADVVAVNNQYWRIESGEDNLSEWAANKGWRLTAAGRVALCDPPPVS